MSDTGDIAHVPAYERLDEDTGEGVDALGDGGADDDLDDVYANPGPIVDASQLGGS